MATAPTNMLLKEVKYKVDQTMWGQWSRFLYPDGRLFEEYVSHMTVIGLPLIHITRGICPETGKSRTAKGFLAIGRFAYGVIAIGQVSVGVIAIGQAALSLLFGLGQATVGLVAIGQFGGGIAFGMGQISTGLVAIGQFACGYYAFGQMGLGIHVWDVRHAAPAAVEFFKGLATLKA